MGTARPHIRVTGDTSRGRSVGAGRVVPAPSFIESVHFDFGRTELQLRADLEARAPGFMESLDLQLWTHLGALNRRGRSGPGVSPVGFGFGSHRRDARATTRLMERIEVAERGGFEPPIQFNPYIGLANRRLQPLGHLSRQP